MTHCKRHVEISLDVLEVSDPADDMTVRPSTIENEDFTSAYKAIRQHSKNE